MKRLPRREQFADVPAAIAGKSHFVVRPVNTGWEIIVRRLGRMPQTILAATEGEANRIRLDLSAAGLIGVNRGGAA
jgi:hypothetical protein